MYTLTRRVVLLCCMLLAAWGAAAQAKRIVSLVPSLSEAIYELESQQALLGCTNYCAKAVADKKAVVASAIDVNLERVLNLKPDLVLASNLVKPATVETLRKLGVRVEFFPYPKSYQEIELQYLELATLLGKSALAKTQLKGLQQRLGLLQRQVPTGKQPRVFMEIGSNPLFCVVPNTFMHDYLHLARATNIADDLSLGSIGRETVLVRNPDAIFIVLMGISGEEEKAAWAKFPSLEAVKRNRIFFLDPNLASTPTPLNFVRTLELVMGNLYGK